MRTSARTGTMSRFQWGWNDRMRRSPSVMWWSGRVMGQSVACLRVPRHDCRHLVGNRFAEFSLFSLGCPVFRPESPADGPAYKG